MIFRVLCSYYEVFSMEIVLLDNASGFERDMCHQGMYIIILPKVDRPSSLTQIVHEQRLPGVARVCVGGGVADTTTESGKEGKIEFFVKLMARC